MENSIIPLDKNSLPQTLNEKAELFKREHNVYLGAIFINKRGEHLLKITSIEEKESYKWENGENVKTGKTHLEVTYVRSFDFFKSQERWSTNTLDYLISNEFQREYEPLKIPIEEYRKRILDLIEGKVSIKEYQDKSTDEDEASNALITSKSKETLGLIVGEMNKKKELVEILQTGVKLLMEERKRELDEIRRNLGVIITDFQKKVDKIQKVIDTIELYLGIREDIVQIKDGNAASENTPIHFWQNQLFMDEEVGDPMDDGQGLDFDSIDKFDEWLLKYSKYYGKENYKLLIPQEKGIICLRVRREKKEYYKGDNSFSARWSNMLLNEENMKTYILIRNGEKLYRIWAAISISKLFPNKSQLQEIRDKWDSIKQKEENALIKGDTLNYSEERELNNIEDTLYYYKKNYIMLQGLMDRTEVFDPKPQDIKLLTPEAADKGYVRFVYEDDIRLGDGRLRWKDYVKSINGDLHEGSRIVLIGRNIEYNQYRYDKRYQGWNRKSTDTWHLPSAPSSGIYQLKQYTSSIDKLVNKKMVIESLDHYNSLSEVYQKEYAHLTKPWGIDENRRLNSFPATVNVLDEKGREVTERVPDTCYAIYYNPKDEVRNTWDYWGTDNHDRKNNVSYKIYEEDDFILNYDCITLDDLDYYLYDRQHRVDYIHLMSLLLEVKKQKEKEYQEELSFVKGLVEDMKRKNQKLVDPKKEIWEAIEWFKLKNKWKRSIGANDAHAWKMIRKRLKLNSE